jgi:hypothetical protein
MWLETLFLAIRQTLIPAIPAGVFHKNEASDHRNLVFNAARNPWVVPPIATEILLREHCYGCRVSTNAPFMHNPLLNVVPGLAIVNVSSENAYTATENTTITP